ncbi:Asp23/Gls24 family envelope stress response protein [Cellulomonas sp. URHD0024]|uniref:Asp23/Gls24 family envelope stress response protein n=1 Tax=Cellulomonas sp. URHD0024 TaxID=1302620 RepID=UPI0004148C55|nr:Asp23/Gls24 family envelope stress response protein [Cellulomonas sp. URHD0024]
MTEPVPTTFGADRAHEVLSVGPEPTNLAEVVEAVVLAVPGVSRLDGGRFGGFGTYLPGHRVTGVRIDDDGTEVHIVVSGIEPVPTTAGRVQRAVSAIAPMPVHVHVEDIDVP